MIMAVIPHLIGKPREGMAEKKARKKLPPRPSHSDLSGRKIRVVFDDPDATESSEDEGISHKRKRGICESRVVAPPESDGSKRKKPPAKTLPKAKVKSAGSESSGRFKGVRQRPWGRWAAEIRNPGGSRIWLGTFDTAEAAAAAYKDAALRFKAEKENRSFTGSSSTAATVSCRVKKESQSVSSSSSSSCSTVTAIPFRVKKKKNHSVGVFSSTATTLPLQLKKENLSVTTSSEMTATSSSSSSASVDSPIKQPTSPTSVLDVSSSSSGSPTNSCSEPEEEVEEEESSFADLFEALPLEVEADLGFHSDDFFFSNRLQSEEAIAGWLELEL